MFSFYAVLFCYENRTCSLLQGSISTVRFCFQSFQHSLVVTLWRIELTKKLIGRVQEFNLTTNAALMIRALWRSQSYIREHQWGVLEELRWENLGIHLLIVAEATNHGLKKSSEIFWLQFATNHAGDLKMLMLNVLVSWATQCVCYKTDPVRMMNIAKSCCYMLFLKEDLLRNYLDHNMPMFYKGLVKVLTNYSRFCVLNDFIKATHPLCGILEICFYRFITAWDNRFKTILCTKKQQKYNKKGCMYIVWIVPEGETLSSFFWR